MTSPSLKSLIKQLDILKTNDQFRVLADIRHHNHHVIIDEKSLLNISSNDYLGLGSDASLQAQFISHLQELPDHLRPSMGSTSSRLLTGNNEQLILLEKELLQWYSLALSSQQRAPLSKSVLVMNSGYHANIGILPALASLPLKTLIVADKRVHASIIDGLRLIQNRNCTYKRYQHNDLAHLKLILQQVDVSVERIIIVTESIFSMDGDRADLKGLVTLKVMDSRIELYVDEAHAVGVIGYNGLGLAEETQTLTDIDYLVGTFGKAFASMGAYIICDDNIKHWLINNMRSFIYSTALPPMTHCWTRFVLARMTSFNYLRIYLSQLTLQVVKAINNNQSLDYQSPIVPYIVGDNSSAVIKAKQLQQAGFYVLPIRPPTVPNNTARIRLVMNAKLTASDCARLTQHL